MTSPASDQNGGAAASGQNQPEAVAAPSAQPDQTGQPPTQTGTQQPSEGQTPPVEPPKPHAGSKTYTESEVNKRVGEIVTKRLAEDREKLAKQFAGLLGLEGGEVDPADALKQAQQQASTARQQANQAIAEAVAAQAGITPERVPVFASLVDLSGALEGVDQSDAKAVRAAIDTAVKERAQDFPEWHAQKQKVPAASGGDRGNAASTGEVSLDQFKAMGYADRVNLFERDPNLYQRLADQL